MSTATADSTVQLARRRAKYLTGLLWHIGTFVIINAFFWILNTVASGGVNWAYWITAVWAFALAFHALAYWIDGRQIERRKTRQYVERDRLPTG